MFPEARDWWAWGMTSPSLHQDVSFDEILGAVLWADVTCRKIKEKREIKKPSATCWQRDSVPTIGWITFSKISWCTKQQSSEQAVNSTLPFAEVSRWNLLRESFKSLSLKSITEIFRWSLLLVFLWSHLLKSATEVTGVSYRTVDKVSHWSLLLVSNWSLLGKTSAGLLLKSSAGLLPQLRRKNFLSCILTSKQQSLVFNYLFN